MTRKIVIDIETLPCADQQQIDYLIESVTADARLKDPEKIAADIAQKRAEVVAKTGLDGGFGRILMASIGVIGSDEIVTFASPEVDERYVLRGLLEEICRIVHENTSTPFPPTFIGHNVLWDLRFIAQRCAINGFTINKRTIPFDEKPWSDRVVDTMQVWAGTANRITLDRLCHALGVKSPKGEMDGSQVAQYFADGRIGDIIAYNRDDVRATRECYEIMHKAGIV